MSSETLEELTELTRKMMESGDVVLADPSCPESIRKMVRAEMENQKRCMEIAKDVLKNS